MRSAFVQEQALRETHQAKQQEWAEHAAGLRDTLSKQARLLSLRQVSRLTVYRQGGDDDASGAHGADHPSTSEAAQAAAALESEIMRLAAGGDDAGDETDSNPVQAPEVARDDGGRVQRVGEKGERQGADGGGGVGETPGLEKEERLRKEANRLVVEDLVRRVADAEGNVRRVNAEMDILRREHALETHSLQAQVRAAEAKATHTRHQLDRAAEAQAQSQVELQALRETLQALSSSVEGAQWAKSASGNQVLALLEEARALRSKLALADATVRQLKEALSQGQLALVARRRAAMQERARLGRREYTLEQRVGFLNEKLEVAERRVAALAEEKGKMQEAATQQLAEIASLQREKGEWLQDKEWQHKQMLELQGKVRMPC